MTSLYLCCDCGGSKTAVAIADASGAIVGRAHGGPSNFAYLGLHNFATVIKSSVEAALASIPGETRTSLPPASQLFAAAWFGISGVDSPAAIASLTPVLSAILLVSPGPRLAIANDIHLLAAPLALHPDVEYAVGVVGGTGSIVGSFRQGAASGELQELARVGGWGWILGDEGGGFHVGREAVRHLLREFEMATLNCTTLAAAAPGSLRQAVLELFGVGSAPELLVAIHDPDPVSEGSGDVIRQGAEGIAAHRLIEREKRLSQLSPLVFRAAFEHCDPLALAVLRATADALAEQVIMLLRADSDSSNSKPAPNSVPAAQAVISFGGSLVGVPAYRALVLDTLAANGHVFAHIEYVADAAVAGARGLAIRYEGGPA